jgi:hypothetical protein
MTEEVKKNDTVEATAQEAPAPAQNGADLTVQDLATLKQIIDVASQRGAFKPNEMMAVGATYNKLEAFLQAIAAQQQAGAPEGEK